MTRSEAITALYALFNAPHNADINLVGLNVLLDDLYKSHPQEEPWPEEPEGHIAGGVHPPQRTWVGLTNDELTDLFYNTNLGQQSAVAQAIALLEEKNT